MLTFPDPNVETEYTDPNGVDWIFDGTGWVKQCECPECPECPDGGLGPNDPYWAETTLLLDGDTGPNGANNNYFSDSSTNNHAITAKGNVVQGSVSPYLYDDSATDITVNGGSAYFSGINGDQENHLDLGAARIPATGNFTFETWVKAGPKSGGNHIILSQYLNSVSGRFRFLIGGSDHGIAPNALISSTDFLDVYGTKVVADNTWHHVVLERSGNNWNLYVDGELDASGNASGSVYTGRNTRIGNSINTSGAHNPLKGYLSDCRLTTSAIYGGNGYTVPFKPVPALPTTSILLNFQDAGIYDRTGKNNLMTVGNAQIDTSIKRYGTGSMKFDGSNSDLRIEATDPISFSGYAGDFTAEMWVYPTAVGAPNNGFVWQHAPTPSGYSPFIIAQRPGTYEFAIYASSNGSGWDLISNATIGTAIEKSWNHIAVVRDGTNIKTFMDGKLGTTSPVSTTALATTSGKICIGSTGGNPNTHFAGYIDDLRITKGVARYTADFTLPPMLLPNTKAFLAEREKQMALTRGEVIDETPDPKYIPYTPTEMPDPIVEIDASANDIDFSNDVTTEE